MVRAGLPFALSMPSGLSAPRRRFRVRYLVLGGALLVLLPFSPLLVFGIAGLILPGVRTYSIPTSAMESSLFLGDYIVASSGSIMPARGMSIILEFPGNRDQTEPDLPQHYIERCVAIAGDTVDIRNSVVRVNGVIEQPAATVTFAPAFAAPTENDAARTFPKGLGFTRDNWGPMRVPKKGDVIPIESGAIALYQTFIRREGHTVEIVGAAVHIDGQPASSYRVEQDYCFGLGDNRWNSSDSRYWGFIPYDAIIGTPSFVYWSWPTAVDRNNDRLANPYDPAESLSLWERIGAIRWGRMFRSIE